MSLEFVSDIETKEIEDLASRKSRDVGTIEQPYNGFHIEPLSDDAGNF